MSHLALGFDSHHATQDGSRQSDRGIDSRGSMVGVEPSHATHA